MTYMQTFTEGSGELAASDSGERRGEFAAAEVMERIKIIAEDSATLEYAKTALTKSPVRIVAKCPGSAGTVPVFDLLSRWCPGLVFVPDFYKKKALFYLQLNRAT